MMIEPPLVAEIKVYRDRDGYVAVWDQGSTWCHVDARSALDVVGWALDEEDENNGKDSPQ